MPACYKVLPHQLLSLYERDSILDGNIVSVGVAVVVAIEIQALINPRTIAVNEQSRQHREIFTVVNARREGDAILIKERLHY